MNRTTAELLEWMCAKVYNNKTYLGGQDWNGEDNSGGVRGDEERTDGRRDAARVWGSWNMPLHELVAHAMNIGATAIIRSGPKSGWYFRNNPKADIIQTIEGEPGRHNKVGTTIYLI
jgi:hypothetical protein